MSEGNHSAVRTIHRSGKLGLSLLFGGVAVALLAGGALFQFWRSEPTSAGVESDEAPPQQAGTARVQKRPGNPKDVARVNGQLISWDMVAQECMSRYATEVLDSMIDRMVVQQACEEQNIQISPAEVEAEIMRISKQFNLTPDTWFQMLQSDRKITPDQYRRNVIWPMLALRKLASEKIEVTDEDMKKAFIRDYGEKVRARMIVLDNQRRAEEVLKLATEQPEDFGRLAQKHSIEPNSKSLNGAIPPIRRYGGNETLENEAFKLKEGEVSGLIQIGTGQQYAILLCEGRTERLVEFDEVKASLHEQIMEEKVQLSVANVFKGLKERAVVQNFLTGTATGGIQKASATEPESPSKPPARPRQAAQKKQEPARFPPESAQ
ncbi:MAG: peptidylprolyl isomerase [Planctomycetaceae bacterium]